MITPKKISSEDIRLGRYKSSEYAVPRWQIPAEMTRPGNPWADVASTLMWAGSGAIVSAREKGGVNREDALRHVGAVLLAVDLEVEHREAAAAYLLNEWFEEVVTATGRASHSVRRGADADAEQLVQ